MSLVAPKARKHLSADALFRLVRNGFDAIADHRSGDAEIFCTHALESTFAMFSLKSPLLLTFDKGQKGFAYLLALHLKPHRAISKLMITQIIRNLSREHDLRDLLMAHYHATFSIGDGF